MRVEVKSGADLGAGLLLIAIAVFFLVVGRDLARGDAFQMGPGYFPTAISLLAGLVGLVLVAGSLFKPGPDVGPVRIVPVLLVFSAMAVFVFGIGRLGLVATGTIVFLLASFAAAGQPWPKRIAVSLSFSLITGLLFVKGLGLAIPLWPAWP